jgi:3,4-dihydroxy 2-butanone 4-phosphate synthase/GTP cyclohydrolase II
MQFSTWFAKQQQDGLTQWRFAKEVGVSQGRIAQILGGDVPSMSLAIRIKEATGGKVTPNDFLGWGRERARA